MMNKLIVKFLFKMSYSFSTILPKVCFHFISLTHFEVTFINNQEECRIILNSEKKMTAEKKKNFRKALLYLTSFIYFDESEGVQISKVFG